MSENVSVIVPFYDKWELTHKCLSDLYYNISQRVEIIVVNDASTGDYDRQVEFWHNTKKHNIRYIKSKENLGFGGAMNLGAKYATGNILIFFSNDVLVFKSTPDFVQEIVLLLERNKALVGGELLDRDTGWNVVDGKMCPYVNGWLLACTREAWDEVGGFDTRYGKYDYEDIDLSLMFLQKGYNLLQLTQSKLQHLGGQTVRAVNPNREQATLQNQLLFHQKWHGKLDFLDGYAKIGGKEPDNPSDI